MASHDSVRYWGDPDGRARHLMDLAKAGYYREDEPLNICLQGLRHLFDLAEELSADRLQEDGFQDLLGECTVVAFMIAASNVQDYAAPWDLREDNGYWGHDPFAIDPDWTPERATRRLRLIESHWRTRGDVHPCSILGYLALVLSTSVVYLAEHHKDAARYRAVVLAHQRLTQQSMRQLLAT